MRYTENKSFAFITIINLDVSKILQTILFVSKISQTEKENQDKLNIESFLVFVGVFDEKKIC